MSRDGRVLRLNPIACDAHGVCAGLLPELVTLDPWGYPVIAAGPVPAELEEHARRAVASCPTLALRLERQPRASARHTSAQRASTQQTSAQRISGPGTAPRS